MNDSIQLAACLCRKFEGLRLRPYVCPAGYWSIGYGNRALANGAAVTAKTAPITQQQAEVLLVFTLEGLRVKLRQLVRTQLSPNREGALLDFQYNLGTAALAGSTLLKDLNAGHDIAASDQLLLWNHMHRNGQLITVPGLTARRHAEWLLWSGVNPCDPQPIAPAPSPNPTDQLNAAEIDRVKENA